MKPYVLRTPTVKSKVGVDRENKMLRGFVVAQIGEAKGHGADLDETTLNQLMELGNAVDGGSKMRFTHPNMSNDGLGKYLGRAKNFRRDGDLLRADGVLGASSFKSPHGDLGSYVLDLAEEDPEAFGASVAMFADLEERLDEEKKPLKGADGKKLPPVFRVKKLHAVDVVDQPAATNAMFTADTWAAQATQFADQLSESLNLSPQEVAAKVQEFIPRYLASKGVAMSDAIKTEPSAPAAPPAEPAKTTPVELSSDQKAAQDALKSIERETERLRCEGISNLCIGLNCPELIGEMIADGVSLSAASQKARKHAAEKNPPLPSGTPPENEKPADPDKALRDEYRANEATLSIFGDEESYIASAKRTAAGGLIPLTGKAG
jgi:hypothetical protein